mmetsp:Transcript_56919/g.133086  ORF Transcript_56919/g.133086 Transcript_56919/m.133086 type:complete len:329 (+) Transcript_56919:83-1069(+)
MAVSRRPPPPDCPPPPAPPSVTARANEALEAAAARQSQAQLPKSGVPRSFGRSHPEQLKKTVEVQGQTSKEVSRKIAQVMVDARQRRAREPLSPREELKRRAEQALRAAKYRGASPETRKRYEVEQAFEDRATKALSEAVARQSADPALLDFEGQGAHQVERDEDLAWGSTGYHMPQDPVLWDGEYHEDPFSGHWMDEVGYPVAFPAGVHSEEGYDSVGWVQDPFDEGLAAGWTMEGSSEHCTGPASMGVNRSSGANHSQWASKRLAGQPRAEEPEVRAWAETTTAASSNRSVASAADSNSENGQVHDDADDADELLASCFRSVTQAT